MNKPELPVSEVLLRTDSIELYKLLKMEGLCDSGGSAKMRIADGLVYVNGDVEIRKRKKISAGDIVEFAGRQIRVRT